MKNKFKINEREIEQDFPPSENVEKANFAIRDARFLKRNPSPSRLFELTKDFFKKKSSVDKRFAEFLKDSNAILPKFQFQKYLERLEKTAGADNVKKYKKHLEETQYKEILEQLFGEELLMGRIIDQKTLRENSLFFRGKSDIKNAKKQGVHLHKLIKSKLEITDDLLSKLILDSDFQTPPKRVCEIGGAWGATIKHIKERFNPEEYQNYEIDGAYAKWAEENLGTKTMPVDGETLSGTKDNSMDLVIANNVLFMMPPIKTYSYLKEMARITAKGGIVIFNALVADFCDGKRLDELLESYFPRRAFCLLPKKFIDLSFRKEEFKLVHKLDLNPNDTTLPYFVFQRIL